MKKTLLKGFARLIARVGVNVQNGQRVEVRCEPEVADFATLVVEECYKIGAEKVEVLFESQELSRLHIQYRSEKVLSTVEKWEEERLKYRLDTLPATIYLLSEDPDGLVGIDQEKYGRSTQERYKVIKPYRDAMDNKYQWCIAAVPGKAWAKKMFPDLTPKKAVEKLWEAILYTSRADGADPVEAWRLHNENLAKRCEFLNSLKIKSLHYTSSNGTDLTVGMIPEARFAAGAETTLSGNVFNPNIPSEEVFISPKRGEAEGIVYSSKPLSWRGELIENFSIRFEKGRAVEVHAEKNEDLLKLLVSMDEGASYLGECALVPYDSPISNSGLIFYNTLFDENASCHLALGEGFTNTIENYENYTLEQCRALGINESMVHEDFMIGTADLSITARTADGDEVEIFRNGNWAFEV
jgi:aminopeptidase